MGPSSHYRGHWGLAGTVALSRRVAGPRGEGSPRHSRRPASPHRAAVPHHGNDLAHDGAYAAGERRSPWDALPRHCAPGPEPGAAPARRHLSARCARFRTLIVAPEMADRPRAASRRDHPFGYDELSLRSLARRNGDLRTARDDRAAKSGAAGAQGRRYDVLASDHRGSWHLALIPRSALALGPAGQLGNSARPHRRDPLPFPIQSPSRKTRRLPTAI